ncbi:hypothetical protein ACJX0J_022467, partial [Zea mays]
TTIYITQLHETHAVVFAYLNILHFTCFIDLFVYLCFFSSIEYFLKINSIFLLNFLYLYFLGTFKRAAIDLRNRWNLSFYWNAD